MCSTYDGIIATEGYTDPRLGDSNRLAVYVNYGAGRETNLSKWGQPFTLSYGIKLQPLPPGVTSTLVADVAGTTSADGTFWRKHCGKIPANALFIVVDMGAVRVKQTYFEVTWSLMAGAQSRPFASTESNEDISVLATSGLGYKNLSYISPILTTHTVLTGKMLAKGLQSPAPTSA